MACACRARHQFRRGLRSRSRAWRVRFRARTDCDNRCGAWRPLSTSSGRWPGGLSLPDLHGRGRDGHRARPGAACVAGHFLHLRCRSRDRTRFRHRTTAARGFSTARTTDFLTSQLWTASAAATRWRFRPKLPLTARVAPLGVIVPYVIDQSGNILREPRPIRALQAPSSSIQLVAGLGCDIGHIRVRANRQPITRSSRERHARARTERHAGSTTDPGTRDAAAGHRRQRLARDPRGRTGRTASAADADAAPGREQSALGANTGANPAGEPSADAGADREPAE